MLDKQKLDRQHQAVELHQRAADNLAFIRSTMERAATFTAVPGLGGLGMGLVAAIVGLQVVGRPVDQSWVRAWLGALAIAVPVGAVGMLWKARKAKMPLFTGVGRKFLLAYVPPVIAGGFLTLPLYEAAPQMLPALWLLLYGAGVIAGGITSIGLIPIMGTLFFTFGIIAALEPDLGSLLMVLGFGGLQILFGAIIAVRHGG